MILKADKGNTTVILDRTGYDEKMINMLNDKTTYKLRKKDPRKVCESKLKALLSSKKRKFGDKLYRRLNTTDGNTPRMYGLSKIHKENIRLRPIVSFVGSTTYELSK